MKIFAGMLKFPVRRVCSAASRQVQNCNHYEGQDVHVYIHEDDGNDQDAIGEEEDVD